MNCIPKIVATINKSSVNNNLACELSRLYKIGIQNYRFNLSKFLGSGDIESLCEKIVETKKLLNIPITILFDIPVPYSKPRLFLPHKQKRVMLHKGDDIYITPKHSLISENKNIFGINDPNIARHLLSNAQHTVVYSDGECSFEVQEVFVADDLIRLVANNSWEIQDGKSLTYGMSIDCADHESQYFDAINYVNPEAVAFSFVSSESDIVKYTNSINKGIEIISKIETKEGVENIDEIGKLSHIMLARGDLLLNSDPSELFLLEKKIIDRITISNRHLYMATGYLSSLRNRSIPSHAELIDLGFALHQKPYAIVLNSDVVRGHIDVAYKIINDMYSLISNAKI